MKKLVSDNGGRRLYFNDLDTLQVDAQVAATAVLAGLKYDCIVSGCTVAKAGDTYTIGAGFVYIGGEILRFLGASGVSLPASLVAGQVTVVSERVYQTGVTGNCITEQFAAIQTGVDSGVPIYPGGGLTMPHVLRGAMWEVGDVKWGGLATADYDDTGKGLPGTAAWGWGLANGQGNRPDLRGRFVAGLDADSADYGRVGKVGGADKVALKVSELPTFTPEINASITDGGADATFKAAHNSSSGANGKAITADSIGGGEQHENRPPYYTLAAKVWVGF